ncbi:hypothetical protein [Weissella confusa]|uniref:hypothetical protein n=3 Tax=Weissella confusa TaxID=1583 RepID=UPI0018F15B82|nr:hypothetical protein [Weissella confusa]MBJ7625144.1 hypothetical protein [Weissella confusa]
MGNKGVNMGIKRIELYEFSEHAAEQLKSRFKTERNNWKNWLTSFNMDAEMVKMQNNGTQVWRSGEVGMVINPHSKVIVTVYHIFSNDFPDELKTDLAKAAQRLKMDHISAFSHDVYRDSAKFAYLSYDTSEEDADNFYKMTVERIRDLEHKADESIKYIEGLNQLIVLKNDVVEEVE